MYFVYDIIINKIFTEGMQTISRHAYFAKQIRQSIMYSPQTESERV